jgi:hypothetical protein
VVGDIQEARVSAEMDYRKREVTTLRRIKED